jgi:hypothetical protein
MRLPSVLSYVVVVVASSAHAGTPKVKAQFLCGTMVDGQVTGVVPDKKKPKLVGPVACALHVDDAAGQDGALTVIKTVRYVVDPATKKTSKVDGANVSGSVVKGDDGKYADTLATFKPNEADQSGQIAFRSCEDFDVIATVGDAAGTLFTKTVHVAQKCPKPKAMKATVACFASHDDGTTYALPAKDKRRLTNLTGITCRVTSKDDRLAAQGTKAAGTMRWTQYDGEKDAPRESAERVAAGPVAEGDTYSAEIVFQPGDWDECVKVSTSIVVSDADGAPLFAKTLGFSQDCPD